MKMSKKSNKNLFEFLRYAIVGGIAALVDMGVLALFKEVVFGGERKGFGTYYCDYGGLFCGSCREFYTLENICFHLGRAA